MKSAFYGMVGTSALILVLLMVAKALHARRVGSSQKSSPFECGFDPYGSGRFPFSLQFFLMAIIFLLFDLEIALIYPLASLSAGHMSEDAAVSGYVFLAGVLMGLVHEWNEGSLQWKS